MKKLVTSLSVLCLLIVAICSCSCHVGNLGGLKPSNHQISRSFNNIKDFSSIYSTSVANIEYIQSDTVSVVIEGPDNYVPLFLVREENGVLKIDMKDKARISKGSFVKIKLSSPKFNKLENEGVGNVKLLGKIQSDVVEIDNDAVGNIKVENLICKRLEISSDGVGNLNLAGTCESASYSVDGVGNLNAKEMKVSNLEVDLAGVGNITCFASKSLVVKSDGVGNVKYAGNPVSKQINRDGVGSVKPID